MATKGIARQWTATSHGMRISNPGRTSRTLRVVCEATTQVKRNKNISKLQAGYLFPEIARRRNAHQEANPDAKIISLGIGDTTEPIPPYIVNGLMKGAEAMGTLEGYKGYGPEQGYAPIREAIFNRLYSNTGLNAGNIYVSDGSKCDIGRMQMMFGEDITVALQDPAYPVYVDSSVIMGMTGDYNGTNFDGITYMECRPENDFFPDLSKAARTDIIFFCSPNNPTGSAATREQLTQLVDFAKKNGSIIVYDAAYALFIEDDNCPRSIFEIPGAEECAIETCSFSKYAGFTGVRLGWTVISDTLKFADGSSVAKDFVRIATTVFNGASVISQAGGIACMEDEGWKEMNELVAYYKENAKILKKTFQDMGFTVYGADNAPYVWVGFPGRDSWDVFSEILTKCDIVTTPGSGFGAAGEGFVRASAFGHRENILEAVERFKKCALHFKDDIIFALESLTRGSLPPGGIMSREMITVYILLFSLSLMSLKSGRSLLYKFFDTCIALILLCLISAVVLGIPFAITYLSCRGVWFVCASLYSYIAQPL